MVTNNPGNTLRMYVLHTILIALLASHFTYQYEDNSHLIVRKKKQTYYLCGTAPNTYYSTVPCNNARAKCPNGGWSLNVGCTFSAQCTPYYNGASTCINGCCCTIPTPTPPPNNRFGYCPSGQASEVRCSGRGQCSTGEVCMSGLCCSITGNEWKVACGGQTAISSCTNGGCAGGFHCTASNYCCECPVGISSGRCSNGLCPSGSTCQSNGFCCSSCPGNVMPFGLCRNGVCGGGRSCRVGNICC